MLLPSFAYRPGYYRVYHALQAITEVPIASFPFLQVLEEAVYLLRDYVGDLGQDAARHVRDGPVCELYYGDYDVEKSVETVVVLTVYLECLYCFNEEGVGSFVRQRLSCRELLVELLVQ